MNKKTALVSGGTSGIGLSIVKALAKDSYNVYFIGTNSSKGEEIENLLKSEYQNSVIKFINLDLGNLKLIKKFVADFEKENSRLDLLANIAGTLIPNRRESSDGIEMNLAISYLTPFYLTNQLIPLLKKSPQGRIVNVGASPSIILKTDLNFDDLNSLKEYNGFKASTLSVHAKTVFTQTLAEKLSKTNITVNSFHPGNIRSNLFRNLPPFQRSLMKGFSLFFKKQSDTALYVCLNKEISEITGKLFVGKKPVSLNFDENYQNRLWEESKKLLESSGIAFPKNI